MRLDRPRSPFQKLNFHGESVTIDTEGTVLVLPTNDSTLLSLFNEYTLDSNRLTIEESPFGGVKGTTPDYSIGSIHVTSGTNVYVDDPTENNEGTGLSAGKLTELNRLTIDTSAKTITNQFIIKNNDIANTPSVIDACDSTSGWSLSNGTGTITVENGRIKVVGISDSNGFLVLQKDFTFNASSHSFITFNIESSVYGLARFAVVSGTGYKVWSSSRFAITANTNTRFVYPLDAPQGTIGSLPTTVSGTLAKDNITLLKPGIIIDPNTAVTFYLDSIAVDVVKSAYVEIRVPDNLADTSATIQCWDGSAYQTCLVCKLDSGYTEVSSTTANVKFLDGTKLDDVYGSGNGRSVFPKGDAFQTVSGSLADSSMTYSALAGTKFRIGIRVDLSPSDNARTQLSKILFKVILNYTAEYSGSTTYIFSDDLDTSTGLRNLSKNWIALYYPASNEVNFYLTNNRFIKIEFKRNESGLIYELVLYPDNDLLYYGQLNYPNLTLDSNSDTIPNVFDWVTEGSVTRFLHAYTPSSYLTNLIPPTIAEVTPVSSSTTTARPTYTFSSDSYGYITYFNCSSKTKIATSGNNTITFDTLPPNIYSNLAIIVTNAFGVQSNVLSVSPFTVPALNATYVLPAISHTKILPKSEISSAYVSNTITADIAKNEYRSLSFVFYSTVSHDNLTVNVSDLSDGSNTIQSSAIDIRSVKCWYQGHYYRYDYNVAGRYLTPELLLHDDSLVHVEGDDLAINVTGNEYLSDSILNPDGKNYLKVDGSYVDISIAGNTGAPTIIPISDRPIQDAAALQPLSIPVDYNKQFWLTVHIPSDAIAGNYTGTITIASGATTLKTITLNITVLPITLSLPNIEYSVYYQGIITANGSISSLNKTTAQFTAEMQNMLTHGITNPTVFKPANDATLVQEMVIRQSVGIDNTNFYYVDSIDPSEISTYKTLLAPYGVVDVYQYGEDEQTVDRTRLNAEHNAGGKHFNAQSIEQAQAAADILDLAIVPLDPNPTLAALYETNSHKLFSYANPQTVPEYPRLFRMNYGLLLWQNNYDGAMDFAYQCGFGDVWNDFDYTTFRDHNFTYPTANGVIDTVQWEGFREAVTDMRYLATLQAAISAHPGTTATEANDWLTTLKTTDLSSVDLDEIRQTMIDYILLIVD